MGLLVIMDSEKKKRDVGGNMNFFAEGLVWAVIYFRRYNYKTTWKPKPLIWPQVTE